MELLYSWIAVVVLGTATLTCSAQVVGDAYQNACEDAGYHYYRDGERWACRANPPSTWEGSDSESAAIGGDVAECVGGLIGGVL